MVPWSGSTRRITARASEVLPHPDSPTSASTSPLCMSNETPSTASTGFARRFRAA